MIAKSIPALAGFLSVLALGFIALLTWVYFENRSALNELESQVARLEAELLVGIQPGPPGPTGPQGPIGPPGPRGPEGLSGLDAVDVEGQVFDLEDRIDDFEGRLDDVEGLASDLDFRVGFGSTFGDSVTDRLDAIEEELCGSLFDGSLKERIGTIEDALGVGPGRPFFDSCP